MNIISIVGRLTGDPELRRTGEGNAVCSYSVAVRRPRVKDTTDFINCVTWRQGAEYLAKYGHKGDIVAIVGSMQSRKWTDKNGNNRIEWEIVTDGVELLSSKKSEETTPAQPAYPQPNYPQPNYPQPNYPQANYGVMTDPDANLPF